MIAPAMLGTAIRSRVGTRRMRRRAFVELVMPREYLATQDRDRLCADLGTLFGRDLADQPPIVMQQLRAMGRYDASEKLAALRGIPTLVVSATHDCIARPAYGRALAGRHSRCALRRDPRRRPRGRHPEKRADQRLLATHMLAAPRGVEARGHSRDSET